MKGTNNVKNRPKSFVRLLPKKVQKFQLSELDKAVDKAVECATNNNEKGLQSAMELIGRLMVKK